MPRLPSRLWQAAADCPLMSRLPSRLWQAAADCPLMPLLPSRLWQVAAYCPLMDIAAAFLLLSLCCLSTRGVFHCIACLSADGYPLMPSRLWQIAANCPLTPRLHFRWWQAAAAFILLSLFFLSTRGVFHYIVCLSADDYPVVPLLPSRLWQATADCLLPFRWWLSADASAAFPLMTGRWCLSPARYFRRCLRSVHGVLSLNTSFTK